MASPDLSRIAGNIAALNSLYSLQNINQNLAAAQTRLSSGKRINSAEDDPAGLRFATKFAVRSEGLQVAMDSISDAKNLLSVTEGGLRKISDILVKVRNKAEQAVSDTLGTEERSAISAQITEFLGQVDTIVSQTKWNNNALIDGNFTGKTFQIGADSGDTLSYGLAGSHTAATLLGTSTVSVSTAAAATTYMASVASAISTVSTSLASVGSTMARLTFQEQNLTVAHANTEAAYNRIMNANMAREQVEASKYLILQQTATAMLAQANSTPQYILSLFR